MPDKFGAMPSTSPNLDLDFDLDAVCREVSAVSADPTSPEWVPHFLKKSLLCAPPGACNWRFVEDLDGMVELDAVTPEPRGDLNAGEEAIEIPVKNWADCGTMPDAETDDTEAQEKFPEEAVLGVPVEIDTKGGSEWWPLNALEDDWYEARNGDPEAMIRVAVHCVFIFRWWRGAEYWAKKAVAAGDPEAAYYLAMLYDRGMAWDAETDRQAQPDPEMARHWFREARRALFKAVRTPEGTRKLEWYGKLAFLLAHGVGGPVRPLRAIRLYREARRHYPGRLSAELGSLVAMLMLCESPMPSLSVQEMVFTFRALLQQGIRAGQRDVIRFDRRLLAGLARFSHARRCPNRRFPRWRLPARYLADTITHHHGLDRTRQLW